MYTHCVRALILQLYKCTILWKKVDLTELTMVDRMIFPFHIKSINELADFMYLYMYPACVNCNPVRVLLSM